MDKLGPFSHTLSDVPVSDGGVPSALSSKTKILKAEPSLKETKCAESTASIQVNATQRTSVPVYSRGPPCHPAPPLREEKCVFLLVHACCMSLQRSAFEL